jgi:hypothetical protein
MVRPRRGFLNLHPQLRGIIANIASWCKAAAFWSLPIFPNRSRSSPKNAFTGFKLQKTQNFRLSCVRPGLIIPLPVPPHFLRQVS